MPRAMVPIRGERDVFKEHTLPSGNIISLSSEGDHPTKPWQVVCCEESGEVRWSKDFATQEEAEAEYVRFD